MLRDQIEVPVSNIREHLYGLRKELNEKENALATELDGLDTTEKRARQMRLQEIATLKENIRLRQLSEKESPIPDWVVNGGEKEHVFYAQAVTYQNLTWFQRKKLFAASTESWIDSNTKALWSSMLNKKLLWKGPNPDQLQQHKKIASTAQSCALALTIVFGIIGLVGGWKIGAGLSNWNGFLEAIGAFIKSCFSSVATAVVSAAIAGGALPEGLSYWAKKNENFHNRKLDIKPVWDSVPGSFTAYDRNLKAVAELAVLKKGVRDKNNNLEILEKSLKDCHEKHRQSLENETRTRNTLQNTQNRLAKENDELNRIMPGIQEVLACAQTPTVPLPEKWKTLSLANLLPIIQNSVSHANALNTKAVTAKAINDLNTEPVIPKTPPQSEQIQRVSRGGPKPE